MIASTGISTFQVVSALPTRASQRTPIGLTAVKVTITMTAPTIPKPCRVVPCTRSWRRDRTTRTGSPPARRWGPRWPPGCRRTSRTWLPPGSRTRECGKRLVPRETGNNLPGTVNKAGLAAFPGRPNSTRAAPCADVSRAAAHRRPCYADNIPSGPQRIASCLLRLLPVVILLALTRIFVPGGAMLLPHLLILAVLLGPALLPRAILYPQPPGRSDADDGGGPGPPEPPTPPDAPRGGVPLLDADPTRIRVRDHGRLDLVPSRKRRAAREPDRTPVRAPRRVLEQQSGHPRRCRRGPLPDEP